MRYKCSFRRRSKQSFSTRIDTYWLAKCIRLHRPHVTSDACKMYTHRLNRFTYPLQQVLMHKYSISLRASLLYPYLQTFRRFEAASCCILMQRMSIMTSLILFSYFLCCIVSPACSLFSYHSARSISPGLQAHVF